MDAVGKIEPMDKNVEVMGKNNESNNYYRIF